MYIDDLPSTYQEGKHLSPRLQTTRLPKSWENISLNLLKFEVLANHTFSNV